MNILTSQSRMCFSVQKYNSNTSEKSTLTKDSLKQSFSGLINTTEGMTHTYQKHLLSTLVVP